MALQKKLIKNFVVKKSQRLREVLFFQKLILIKTECSGTISKNKIKNVYSNRTIFVKGRKATFSLSYLHYADGLITVFKAMLSIFSQSL
jgi:hypothetical protein